MEKGVQRTIESLLEFVENYKKFGKGNRKNLKFYFNCEFVPIITGNLDEKETIILCKVPPPHLHLKLGTVNALMKELELIDEDGYRKFLRQLHIVKENYQGKTFEGNKCSKILKNLELLKSCQVQYEITKSIIGTLQAIKDFIVACCSKYLKASWKKSIQNVTKTWSFLHETYGISIPNKAHIIMAHVDEYIFLTGNLLAE